MSGRDTAAQARLAIAKIREAGLRKEAATVEKLLRSAQAQRKTNSRLWHDNQALRKAILDMEKLDEKDHLRDSHRTD